MPREAAAVFSEKSSSPSSLRRSSPGVSDWPQALVVKDLCLELNSMLAPSPSSEPEPQFHYVIPTEPNSSLQGKLIKKRF